MILVLNLNASIDKRYEMKDITKGYVMRASHVENTPGGKGIHVANVINKLSEECLATGFLGGKTGEFIEEKLKEYNITQDFVKIQGQTRECIAIITDDLVQTEILEPGPEVTEEEKDRLIEKYKEHLKYCDMVVASGSMPRNIPKDFYKTLIEIANSYGKKFLLDTSGDALRFAMEAKPFFIKPNKDEIEALTGRKVQNDEDVIREIRELQSKGIKLVAVSLGSKGAMAGYKGRIYKVIPPKVNAINPVGSGDSFVAGIAVGIKRGYSIEDILRYASACGTANAMEKETGSVQKEVVEKLLKDIKVIEVLE